MTSDLSSELPPGRASRWPKAAAWPRKARSVQWLVFSWQLLSDLPSPISDLRRPLVAPATCFVPLGCLLSSWSVRRSGTAKL